jgi:ankyrin repeat protein
VDLFEAIEADDTAEVRRILAADPGLAGLRRPAGVSAVLSARYRQNQALVEAVLEADPELDLFDAAALGRIDRLTELLDADPDSDRDVVNAWAPDGFTALSLAAFFGQPRAVALLVERGADVSAVSRNAMEVQALHAATAARNADAVTILLEAGADPDARQHGGWTPLAAARHAGQDAIAEILLAHGADPSTAAGPSTLGAPSTDTTDTTDTSDT